MEYIVIYKDKHYSVNGATKVNAALTAFPLIQNDFKVSEIQSDELTIIEPKEFITVYGTYLNLNDNTETIDGKTYPLFSEKHFFLKKVCKPKTIYYHNGKRYEIEH